MSPLAKLVAWLGVIVVVGAVYIAFVAFVSASL